MLAFIGEKIRNPRSKIQNQKVPSLWLTWDFRAKFYLRLRLFNLPCPFW